MAAEMARRRGEQVAHALLDEFSRMELMVLPAYYFWDGHRDVVGRRSSRRSPNGRRSMTARVNRCHPALEVQRQGGRGRRTF